jgi:capsular exopolysaccharide synthesis family protein
MQVLWRRRWTVLLMCALALGSGLVYLWKTPYLYHATARVYVQQMPGDIIGSGNGAVGGTSTPTDNYLYLQCELIKSDAVLKYMDPPVLVNADGKTHTTILPAQAKGGLTVEFTPRDGIIFITDESSRADESSAVVNAVVDAYQKYQDNLSQSTFRDLTKKLDDQQRNLEGDLAKAEKEREDFVKTYGMSIVDIQSSPVLEEFQLWSQKVSAAHVKQDETKQQLDDAIAVQDNPGELSQLIQVQRAQGLTVPVDTEADDLNQTLAADQQRLQEMQGGNAIGAKSPALRSLVAQIDDLQKQIALRTKQEASVYIEFLRHQSQYANEDYNRIKTEADNAEANAVKFNALAARYTTLVANVASLNKLKDALSEREKAVSFNVGNQLAQVEVLELAFTPNAPYSPQPAKTLPAALVAGLILGIGCALMQNWIDQRIISSDEVRVRLSIPLLGAVPRLGGRRSVIDAALTVHADPHSRFAEAYRAIRTAVFFGTSGSTGKTVLLTSPQPGDGKTTSVASLSIATAQAGQRTLLVDADLRNPTQHRVFGSDNRVGLSTLLVGTASIKTAIMPTGIDNLDLLCSGPMPSNPSEMLSSRGFAALLEELAGRYDYIVIDSPPALTVTDAGILGAMADMTVLVLRWNKSTQKDARETRDLLLGVGARIFGAIINDVPRGMRNYTYYYGNVPEPIASRNVAVRRKALAVPDDVGVSDDKHGESSSVRKSGHGSVSGGAASVSPGAAHVSGSTHSTMPQSGTAHSSSSHGSTKPPTKNA